MNDNTSVKLGAKWLLLFSALLLVLSPAVKAQAEAQGTAQENIAQIAGDTPPQGNVDVTQGPTDADDMLAPDDKNDPPSRVARISFTDGSVSMQPGGAGDWGTATKNRPVTIGDKLWTDANSRAELQAGQASIHLGDMTALSFLNLNETIIQMRLAEGKINFRVREIRQGDVYEVDTPNLSFTVTQAGAFRIDVNENGDFTSVTVVRGQGDVSAAGQNYTLHAGERADITGSDSNVHYAASSAPEPDTLDRWAQERDLKEDNSTSARHVSRDVVGYSDLDDYGTWKEDPQYGSVWAPNNVPADWAPYSTGYWSYVNPWGYTWVDYAPWGFAPFHYGRWNYFGSYWGWCPGPIYARAFYGPAFVGFLGGGFGFGINFGFGFGHAWFPLGWGEPYRPWYRGGPGYWHGVNARNTFIRNGNYVHTNHFNYAYAHNARAVTAASHSAFVNGQSINRGAMRLNQSQLRNTSVTNRLNNASPGRGSTFGAATARGNVRTPGANVENRSVVARNTPAAGASHLATRTTGMGGVNNRGGFGNNRSNGNAPTSFGGQSRGTAMQATPGMNNNRQSQISGNRPPANFAGGNRGGASINSANNARPGNSGRSWNAQGNATDSGRGPQGFGNNRPSGGSVQSTRMNDANRPPWSRNGASGASNGSASQNQRSTMSNRAPASMGNNNRNYTPPSNNGNRGSASPYGGNRGYSASPNRNYNAPSSRGYSSAPSYNRGYSAPRSYSSAPRYSAPSAPRSYSAPRSSGGGGGSFHGGGSSGGGSHGGGGGGGGSHGGGGGGSHGGGGHR